MANVKISDSGGREVSVTNNNALKVDPSGTTQPVIITTGNNVIGQIKITDGTDVADILDLANSNPLAVAIVDANGDQITSFGGGTEYTEGDTDTSIKGKAVLMEVAGNALAPLQGTVSDGLLVNLGSNNDVAVTSSALPTGAATAANQATIIGHVVGIEALLTTIDADTSNISTKIDTIAGAVSGTEMQVDVLTMPTVTVQATNLDIRDLVFATDKVDISGSTLAANSGVDIGDVTINNAAGASAVNIQDGGNSITVDDGGGSITVDGTISISGAIDTELPAATALADNTANPTAPAVGSFGMLWNGTTWDRVPGTLANGMLVNLGLNNGVTQSGTWSVRTQDGSGNALTSATRGSERALSVQLVDASGTQITSFGGGTQYTEDVASASDPVGNMLMAVRADTLAAVTTTDGDNIALRSTNKGELYVKQTDVVPINDNGGSITVDGTVAATQSGTWNIGTVTTITNVVHVDDNSGSITVDNGGTFATQENGAALTSLQLIDDVVYTDDTSTHSTGSSKGMAMMGVATPTDTAVNANDFGIVGMTNNRELYSVIRDAAGNARGANVNASNQLSVSVDNTVTVASHAVTNAGTFAVQDSQVIADNAGFTDGTTKLFMGGYVYDEVAGTALTENDGAAARINVNRAQVHTIEDGSTRGRYATVTASNALKVDASGVAVPITDNSGSLTVDAPVGTPVFVRLSDGSSAISTLPVSIASGATTIGKAEDVASADGDVGVPAMAVRKATPANTSGTDGDYEMLQISAGRLWTSATIDAALPTGTNSIGKISDITTAIVPGTGATNLGKAEDSVAGSGDTGVFSLSVANEAQSTLAGDGDYIARAADTKGNSLMVGNLAHDAVDAGNPVKIGAQARQTNPTAVADGDRVNITADDLGRQIIVVGQVRDLIVDNTTTITSSTSETTILAAVASTFLDIRCLWVSNTSATAVRVDFRDTTAGSVRFSLQVPAGDTRGFVVPTAIKQTTANNNWTAQSSGSVADLMIYIQAEKNI